jgi:hypothetical protein
MLIELTPEDIDLLIYWFEVVDREGESDLDSLTLVAGLYQTICKPVPDHIKYQTQKYKSWKREGK